VVTWGRIGRVNPTASGASAVRQRRGALGGRPRRAPPPVDRELTRAADPWRDSRCLIREATLRERGTGADRRRSTGRSRT